MCLIGHGHNLPRNRWVIALISLFLVFSSFQATAQTESNFDEITIFFQIQNIGTIEIPALIRDQEVLLPITDIFEYIKVKTTFTPNLDSISGFFLSPQNPYQINHTKNKIQFQGKTYSLKPGDLIKTETNLYLLSKYFGEIFGLDCKFNFRALSVNLTTKLELPAMRELRLEQMRSNINRLKGDTKVDTIIGRKNKPFHFGMADWTIISTQEVGKKIDNKINISLGTIIAGGEANASLNYNSGEAFSEKQQYYYWRFVNNENRILRQSTVGKIATDAISSVYNSVIGVRFTNTPTTYRRSFGTYPLSDYTNPNWMVELYVNSVLVDYKKADANGFFNFQVPLVYGNSAIKLKFYGPWGEEASKEQQISIPFNFMPPGEFEYTVNGGLVEDTLQSIYSRAAINYGISRGITIGGGVEYLSSIVTGQFIPFASLATRPLSNILLSGEYVYGVRAKGIFSFQAPKNIQFELNYTKYQPGQKAVNSNYLEERKAILTLPINGKSFSFYNRMTFNQTVLQGTDYTTAEWLLSGTLFGVSSNLTNYAMFVKNNNPFIYSNLSFSLRLPHGFLLNPQAQYEHSQHELISAKAGLEKYIFKKGFFSLSYENNFKSRIQSMQFSFRYDLPFAQTALTSRLTNDQVTLMEMARGSLIMDRKSKFFSANNRVSVGKGGIIFAPFLDLNCNNKRDENEPRAFGLNIRISGGTATSNDRDTTVRVMDLEPYTKYYVELDANSFDNVAWKIHNRTMSVVVEPNSFKLVEIPVAVVGEVSGMVYKQTGENQDGLGRIIVNIFNTKSQLAAKTLSEPDGYYSYLGLAPGKYEARVDTVQLGKIHMIASPNYHAFNIKVNREGDIVEGLDFSLKSTLPEVVDSTYVEVPKITIEEQVPAGKPDVKPAVQPAAKPEVKPGVPPAAVAEAKPSVQPSTAVSQPSVVPAPGTKDQYIATETDQIYLQTGAFRSRNNAQKMANLQSSKINFNVELVLEDGWYKVRFGGFEDKNEAEVCKQAIIASGIVKANQISEIHHTRTEYTKKAASQPVVPPTVVPVKTQDKGQTEPAKTPAAALPANVPVNVIKAQPNATDISVSNEPITKGVTAQKSTKEIVVTPAGDFKADDILKRQYFVQIGAFINPKNSTRLIKTVSKLIPYSVGIVYREEFYKVRFGPFLTQEELNDCIRLVVNAGILQKNLLKIFYEEIGSTPLADKMASMKGEFVQVGAFKDKANAARFFKKMSSEYPFPILITEVDGYHKVRFGPFKSSSDTKKCRKALQANKVDCFVLNN